MNTYYNRIVSALKKLADKVDADDASRVEDDSFFDDVPESLERIADKYEAGGGGGGGIDLGITGASVGEYAKIKTVDADGAPTAWESGTGGGGGGGEGVFVCHIGNDDALDKTWQEIKDAINDGKVVTIAEYNLDPETHGEFAFVFMAEVLSGIYYVHLVTVNGSEEPGIANLLVSTYTTNSANGYPVMS